MADISLCRNESCPSAKSCKRFLTKPGFWQSYSNFNPKKEENCDFYIKVGCKYIKKEGASCSLNNKCKYPNCESK